MKHTIGVRSSHSTAGARTSNTEILLADPRHPDAAFVQRELDLDRKREWYLIPKTFLALAIVAVLVILHQVYLA